MDNVQFPNKEVTMPAASIDEMKTYLTMQDLGQVSESRMIKQKE
jgi:hypothetical protein